jgi:hypothetical protein
MRNHQLNTAASPDVIDKDQRMVAAMLAVIKAQIRLPDRKVRLSMTIKTKREGFIFFS